jgi:hypothetical protein
MAGVLLDLDGACGDAMAGVLRDLDGACGYATGPRADG